MEIFLHCGFPKTGSTFLQSFFHSNKHQLEKNGIFYPTIPGSAQYDCSMGVPPCGSPDPMKNMLFYINQAQAKKFDKILFSNELFLHTDFTSFDFLKQHHIVGIFFIRYFTSQRELVIQENMRTPVCPPQNSIDIHSTPGKILNSLLYMKQFCSEMHVYSYELSQKENIAKKFLKILKITDYSEFKFDIGNIITKNRTLYTSEAIFVNEIKVLPLSHTYDVYFYLLKKCITSLKNYYLYIPVDKYLDIFNNYSDSIKKLSELMEYETYGNDSLDWLNNMEECPWRELPQEIFDEIFNNLSEKIQHGILEALPSGRQPYESIKALQSQDFFPGYLFKQMLPANHPITYKNALTIAGKSLFDPSCRDGPFTLHPSFFNFKHSTKLLYDDKKKNFSKFIFSKRYRQCLLVELANKLDIETIAFLESDESGYPNEFLEHLLWKTIRSRHLEYINQEAERIAGKDVYFWGCGEVYNFMNIIFCRNSVKAILVDTQCCLCQIDGIPVCHPDNVLLSEDKNIPIVIFSNQAQYIYKKIQKNYPAYTDIIFCTCY